jgi:hypothetical protein
VRNLIRIRPSVGVEEVRRRDEGRAAAHPRQRARLGGAAQRLVLRRPLLYSARPPRADHHRRQRVAIRAQALRARAATRSWRRPCTASPTPTSGRSRISFAASPDKLPQRLCRRQRPSLR